MSFADTLGGAGNAIGSAVGYFSTGENRQAAQSDYEKALAGYQDLRDPHLAQYISAQGNQDDRAAQLEAMQQLRNIYSNGGLDAATRAQLQSAQQSNAQQAQALNSSVRNQMAQRGMANSGASFAQQQQANQAAQNQNNMASQQAMALGRQQQMAALGQYGQMAGGLRSADDAISQFNAANQNAGNRFNAQQTNAMDQFRVGGQQSALDNMAANQSDQGQAEMNAAGGIGKGVGTVAGAVLDAYTGGGGMGGMMGGK